MNGVEYNVGRVVLVNHTIVKVGIVLGILAAIGVGAAIAFIFMKHLKTKQKGEQGLWLSNKSGQSSRRHVSLRASLDQK